MKWTGVFQHSESSSNQNGSNGHHAFSVGSQGTFNAKDQPFFAFDGTVTDQELRDISANLALTGQPYEVLTDTILHQEDLAKDAIHGPFEHESNNLTTRKSFVVEKIGDVRNRISGVEARITSLFANLRESKMQTAITAALKSSFAFKLQQARLARGRALWEETEKKLADTPTELYEQLKSQIAGARELHQEWENAWKKDEPELQRRAEYYREQLSEAKLSLKKLTDHLDFLKALGFTRTIAGFLVWGGYLWLAGNAVVVSEVLSNSSLPKTSIIAALLSPLSTWIGRTPFWTALLTYLGAALLCLIAVGLVTVAIDALLRWLNPSWAATTWTRKGSNQNSFSMKGIWAGVRDLFDANPLESVGTEAKKTASLEPTTRWTHLQTIAMLPSLFIGLLLLFLLGAAGTAVVKSGTSLPDVSMLYVGVVWSVVMASSALLYTCHVIQFRWLRMGWDADNANAWPWYQRLFLNWEYLLTAAAFLASTVAVAWGIAPAQRLGVWPPILCSFCVASLTLAYGMVLLGFFRDQRFLEGRLATYQTLLDETLSAPCLTDLFDIEAFRGTSREAGELARTRHRLRELLLLKRIDDQYELEADRTPFAQGLLDFMARRLGVGSLERPKRRLPSADEIVNFIELPAELVQEWADLEQRLQEAINSCTATEEQIRVERDSIVDLEQKLTEEEQGLRKLEEEHIRLIRETGTKVREVSSRFARARWVSLSAYSMGLQCRWDSPNMPPDDWDKDPVPPLPDDGPPGAADDSSTKSAAAGGKQ